ncbi:MAG: HNH endonuclease signature motif containing protein [Actinomycetota bacterium]|nr:HNH endonuclease signature motif containing protein [Actinomycetota bacterium]MDA2949481.1 HNH endonuclease signature motif containing protein [Actinomycetota bacterium]
MYSTDIDGAVGQIEAAIDVLESVDLSRLSAGDLVRLAGRCEKLARRQAVVRGDIVVEVGRRAVSEVGGSPHEVLADWLRITPAEARRRAAVAEPLASRTTLTGEPLPARQPATAQAWRKGLLDGEHVRVIQRFLAELPVAVPRDDRDRAEAFLAEHALSLRPDQLARLAERLALTLNPDGQFSDADRALRRGFTWSRQDISGMSTGRLVATPALRAELDAWFAKFAAPGMCNPGDPRPAVDGQPSQDQIDADRRSPAQRQHDALSALVRGQLGDPKLGTHRGLPVTVIVSANLQDLQCRTGVGVTAGGTVLPMADVIRMAGHAYHYLTLFDQASGRPLWLGRSKRIASADQRVVLQEMDRGCTFPGCTVPGYGCQVHHANKGWADGGGTDIDDLALACGPHNRLVEQCGWTTRRRRDGTTEWLPPPQLPLIGGVNSYHHPDTLVRRFRRTRR